MILGIGVDIVDLQRFQNFLSKPNFVERYFSVSESNLPTHRLAGRFAAREALFKALDAQDLFSWEDVEIINEKNGSPKFIFKNRIAAHFSQKKIHLTISHSLIHAVAFVIIED